MKQPQRSALASHVITLNRLLHLNITIKLSNLFLLHNRKHDVDHFECQFSKISISDALFSAQIWKKDSGGKRTNPTHEATKTSHFLTDI